MKHSLPWESVPPPIYPAQASLKPRKKWVQVGGWILVVLLLLFGISTRSRNPLLAFVSLAFSVLYLLTLMTKKSAALTSRGLEIFYDMQFTTNYEFFPYSFVNLLNPVYAYVTALFGRNIFWADGSYTNVFGKTKAGKPAGAPEEAHAKALANLEARRAAGKAPKINA